MRLFAAALAVLLLIGCARSEPPAPEPTQAPEQTLHVPGHPLEQQTSGIMEVFPTEKSGDCRLFSFGNQLLFFDGRETTILSGRDLRLSDSVFTGVPVACQGDHLWLYDSDARKLRMLDGTLRERAAVSLPEETLGIPGISPDETLLYFLKSDGLYVLDRSTETSRVLRDNMAIELGSVRCLESGSYLLLNLTDPHGETNTLLLSTEDGSARYEELSPADAAQYSFGTAVLLREHGFQKVVLFDPSGDSRQLLHGAEERFVCFLPGIHALITCTAPEDDRITVSLYDLTTGTKRSTVILPGITRLEHGCITSDGSLYLPAYSEEAGQWWILHWNYDAFPPASDESFLVPFARDRLADTTQAEACRSAARALTDTYGIRFAVLEDAAQVQPWDYSLTAANRTDETLWTLETVDTVLSFFPKAFLSQLQQGWDQLTLCLVESIRGTAAAGSLNRAMGLQFEEDGSCYVVLALAPPDQLRYTLIHEFSHLIDTQVIRFSSAYDNWNDLNPQEFSYSLNTYADMTQYGRYLQGTNRCFVDEYAMSYPAEDRARILEYAVNPGNGELFVAPVMQQKLKRICTGIREGFHLTDAPGSFIWEQYLVQYGDGQ